MTVPPALETERGSALEALVDAASGILSADSLDGTLGRIAHHLRALLRYDDLAVYEIDEPAELLRPVFAVGDWVAEVMSDPIPLGTGVTGWSVAHRRTRNVPNSHEEPLCNVVGGTPDDAEAFVCVPLLAQERVVGALNVYRSLENESFSADEVELVERFATMAALAYDSARQREHLREQVQRDGLTGLLNHRACHERLNAALADDGAVAVVLIDLDHFKVVNDTLGHAEGDRVLVASAERLRSAVRAGDVVGRMGGEEFVLILPGADAEAAEDCAERARAALAELTVHGRPVAASAGVAAAPTDGTEAAVLLENADAALYWAKRSGRGRTVRYVRGAVRPESEQRNEIAALLERGTQAIDIVFQPLVELATGRAGGYEALTRIDVEPRRGPDEWFAQAHRVGLGNELEALAIRAALEVPDRPSGTFLALNVSPRALLSKAVQDTLPSGLTGIVIELTEHEVFGDEDELSRALVNLRARGALIALDDAGAGYAGLQQMIQIAPDILKLDRTLVHGAHADDSRQALLEALIGFASSTGAAICAEGVEDLDDLRALVELDITYAQGYGLCRPAPAWPQPDPAAAASGTSEIRAGLRVSMRTRSGAGAFARGIAELAEELAAAETAWDVGAASTRAAQLLGADDLAVLLVRADQLELISDQYDEVGQCWPIEDYPASRYVLDAGIPGQVIAGDASGDPLELAELERLGFATALLVPVTWGNRPLALLELYRVRAQAFTSHEVDRARVLAQQFGAALDRFS
ncbi:diguanylate cyclase (GGDEF)-like protein [Solirubrobacter pauli]|uniref:Diguanylate cyclase (GGDEF)-like protein n=1 Tax=Solirubrobacter pauli TaxID=166793 RepID=A0A660LIK5_9ACTN|nr:diguanylate cyclase [Solirubrobacter pauli]RKQ93833.1 diguanylate cyclase (GGDEF)-like protein [Solirubrobacter pauli]